MTNLKLQYTNVKKAWEELGLGNPPALSTIEKKLTPELKKIIKDHNCELVITPAINGKFTLKDLIKAFDKKQKRKTWIWDNLWDQYDLAQDMQVRFVFMDADNKWNESHLYELDKTLEQQRQFVKDSGVDALGPIEYIMLQAIHRPKYLDNSTWLRCVGLPDKSVDGRSIVGGVRSVGGQLRFDGCVGFARGDIGVGRSMGLKELEPLASSLPSSLSSTDLQENTKAILKLTEVLEGIFK